MTFVLFPGRHHVLTRFQQKYLGELAAAPADALDLRGQPLFAPGTSPAIEAIVFAVTSANHFGTRRNPFAANRREAAIERMATELPCDVLVYPIDDVGATDRFAEFVVKTIAAKSYGRVELSPDNTVVACSTPEVIALYERLGYRIAPVELAPHPAGDGAMVATRPWELLTAIAEQGRGSWRECGAAAELAPASVHVLAKYNAAEQLTDIFDQAALTEDGDLTGTRDYNVYVRAFDEGAARKTALVRDYIVPGRIVDIGCCTGAVIEQLTAIDRLRESDFYGVEVARTLFAECVHRKEQGAFHNDNVWFYQRDFTAKPLFADGSLHTVLSFSLTHEVESYSGRDTLDRFIELVHRQLAPGGRWINVDVVGPENGDEQVALWLRDDDGDSDGWDRPLPSDSADDAERRRRHRDLLAGLSTRARFRRFAADFRPEDGRPIPYSIETIDGDAYVITSLRDACEYLSKKDYLDNWQSEMHEKFCFYAQSDWHRAATAAGFHVHRDSHQFTNPWIVNNRLSGCAKLFRRGPAGLEAMPYPPTTVVLIADKPTFAG